MEFKWMILYLKLSLLSTPCKEKACERKSSLPFLMSSLLYLSLGSLWLIGALTVEPSLMATLHILSIIGQSLQFGKAIHFFFHCRSKLSSLIDEYKVASEFSAPAVKEKEEEVLRETSKNCKRLFVVFLVLFCTFVIALIILPIFRSLFLNESTPQNDFHVLIDDTNRRHLWFEHWWPADKRGMPTYIFLAAWQAVCLMLMLGAYNGTTITIAMLLINVVGRSQLLLEAAPIALARNRESAREVPQEFKKWVRYHQHYISLVEKINTLFGNMLLVDHFCHTYQLVYYGYIVTKFSAMNSCTICYFAVIPMCYRALLLLVQSVAGQKVMDNSIKLNKKVSQVVANELPHAQGKFKSCLTTLHARCNCGVVEQISANGLFTVSLTSFSKEIGTVGSSLLVLPKLPI